MTTTVTDIDPWKENAKSQRWTSSSGVGCFFAQANNEN